MSQSFFHVGMLLGLLLIGSPGQAEQLGSFLWDDATGASDPAKPLTR